MPLYAPMIARVFSQDTDTMDGQIDQICVDTTRRATLLALRIGPAGTWWADEPWVDGLANDTREFHEARGARRWCFRDVPTTYTDARTIPFEVGARETAAGPRELNTSATTCAQTPSRNVGLDGRGGALAIGLDGNPRAVTATRRGLRYHRWTGTAWETSWIHCLDGTSTASRGCPARPDWGHDYALEAGIVLDFAQRPAVCFVHGERAALAELVFGDVNRYAQPATPLPEARGTAYLAWPESRGWRVERLSAPGTAGLWGCSITAVNPTPGREEYIVAWTEEVADPGRARALWPHVRRVIGPASWTGALRLADVADVPHIWSEAVVCGTDETCGMGTCSAPDPDGRRWCPVVEPSVGPGVENPYSSHFVSVAAINDPTVPHDSIFVAFDIAARRIYLAQLDGPGCACVEPGSACCASSTSATVLGLGHTNMPVPPGSGLEDERRWGVRPQLAMRLSRNRFVEAAAISFSTSRRDSFRGGGTDDEEGWTPALLRLPAPTSDLTVHPLWDLHIHEDAIATHVGRERAFTSAKRLAEAGLPTWVGFTRRAELRFAFATEGEVVPEDHANFITAAPLRAVYAGGDMEDPTDPSLRWSTYVMIEGVTVSHLGLAAALTAGDRMRVLFHNTLSPVAFGSPRPTSGDPPNWDLAMLGSVSYFEEESGQQFGTGLWGSPLYPCKDPPCDSSEPEEPPAPTLVAECKSDRFFETNGEAIVSDAEIALTPSLAPTVRRLAETPEGSAEAILPLLMGDSSYDPDLTTCGGTDGTGLLQDLEALMGEDGRNLLCDSVTGQRVSSMGLTLLGRVLRHAAALALRFQVGGSLPASFLGRGGPTPFEGLAPADVSRPVPPATSIPRWLLSGVTLQSARPLQASDQRYVCLNDGTTRREGNLQVTAEPRSPRTEYPARPVPAGRPGDRELWRYSVFAVPTLTTEEMNNVVRWAPDYDGDGMVCNPDADPPIEDPEDMEIMRRKLRRDIRSGYVAGTADDFASWCRLAAYDDPALRVEEEAEGTPTPARFYPGPRVPPNPLSPLYDRSWWGFKVRTAGVRNIVLDGRPVEPICLSSPGDADIDASGICHGCLFVETDHGAAAGLRAHVPGFGDVCVPWEEPKTSTLPEPPAHGRWSFDPEGGIWHACPGGDDGPPATAPTVPIRCFVDDQCIELGPGTLHWRCLEGLCRPPVYCSTDDDCASGYVCGSGADWDIDRDVCQLPSACASYVGGICAPEGSCEGTVCEEMILGCPGGSEAFVPGGGGCNSCYGYTYATCGGACMDDEEEPYRGCRDRRPLQASGHEYECIETAAVTCPLEPGYCNPAATAPDRFACPAGSRCVESAPHAPWCAIRELLFDEHLASLVGVQPGMFADRGLLATARMVTATGFASLASPDYPSFEMLDSLYQFLNEDALRMFVENMISASYIPDLSDTGISFHEQLFGPDLFWRGLQVTDTVAGQGELVISLGQEENFDVSSVPGIPDSCLPPVLDGPWRLQLGLQPYEHGGTQHWTVTRVLLVNPNTGRDARHPGSGCGCGSEAAASMEGRIMRKIEGASGGLEASVEPAADLLWRLVADEPLTAGLFFGNWELMSALDRLHPTPGRRPPPVTDGVPDEVIGIRITDGKAATRALERR